MKKFYLIIFLFFTFKLFTMNYWENSEALEKKILEYINKPEKSSMLSALLHIAIELDDENLITLLIKNQVDIDLFGKGLNLRIAISKGNLKIIKLLLDNGSKINLQGDCGYTPLIQAAEDAFFNLENKKEIIKFLIQNGAEINLYDNNRQTALIMFAKKYIDLSMHIRWYHSQDQDDSKKNQDIYDILKLLIFSGADTEIYDENGKTVFDYAKYDFKEILEKVVAEYDLYLKSSEYYNETKKTLSKETNLILDINSIVLNYLGFNNPNKRKI